MPEKYLPRKLPRNRDYPGYQFYCTLQMKSAGAQQCFCFAVLSVIDWLKSRLRETDVIPDEIAGLPERGKSAEISPSALQSFTVSSGFSAYAVSLPEHGIWSLRLKEPDADVKNKRKAFPGRFFATNAGLRILDDTRVELGIRIDVTEPEEAEEIDFAFRPTFVRYLYAAPDIILAQVCELPYEQAIAVEDDDGMKLLRAVLDSSEGSMPIILATQAVRFAKEAPSPAIPRPPFSSAPPGPPAGLFPFSAPAVPVPEMYYPFDADNIAAHNFGYAVTFRVSEKMHNALSKRLKKTYNPGDILFAEPKRYGGNVRVLDKDEKDAVQQVWLRAHCYSKDRRYSFGDVQFEFDARNLENRELISRIRASGDMKAEEKLTELNGKIDELQAENESRVRKINELKEQLHSEFTRGEDAEKHRTEELFEEHARLEDELRAAKARNLYLEKENQDARAIRSAVETFRCIPELPGTNEAVIRFFRNVFGDRILFTERAVRMGSRSDIKPEGLWYYLYQMATELFDMHHAGIGDIEHEFENKTGIAVAMGEGSQTNDSEKFKKQRRDCYAGKEIYVYPHVKLETKRTGISQKRRIHYCFDRDMDRIIIGWIGEHMDTAGSVHMN